MNQSLDGLFDRMSALADPVRSRLLLVLERRELNVGELCTTFQLPQSTMSRQLKVLADEGWVTWRAEGTSRRYSAPVDRLGPEAARLWELVRSRVSALPIAQQDALRVREVLAQRTARGRQFISGAAGEWDRLRTELFGQRADLHALLGLLDDRWVVGDLGCGTGQAAESLAPFVRRVVAIDDSREMIAAARQRLAGLENVEVRRGEIEQLPLKSRSLHAAVLFLVFPYVAEPAAALQEVARVLKPGGRLLITDMIPHDREEYRQRMGHLWLGFAEEEITGWLECAGFRGCRYRVLPPDPQAKGPPLFVASGRVGPSSSR